VSLDEGALRARLQPDGGRMTRQRRAILRILDDYPGHIAADEVCRRLQAEDPQINRSTVYRTLQTLEELGLVHHAHDETGARAYHRAAEAAHVHLVCRRCGGEQAIPPNAVEDLSVQIRDRFGFEPDPTHFPIYGVCRGCQR
jgi:Fur family ferric uptake transcriptional regulator